MLNQNYLKVFQNESGTVTIASGHGDPVDFQTLEIQTITISPDDLVTLADAFNALAMDIDEENRHA